jgi:hypothetical protein
MLALQVHARSSPEQVGYEPAPVPAARPGQTLIAVRAAAIMFAELTWGPVIDHPGRRTPDAGYTFAQDVGHSRRARYCVTGPAVSDEVPANQIRP